MKTFTNLTAMALAVGMLLAGCKKENEPPVISIETQPTAPSAALVEGIIPADTKLTVAAKATEGAALTYQWYENTSASNTGGTAISGATTASYTLPTTLTAKTYYYFCEVGAAKAAAKRTAAVTVLIMPKPTVPGMAIQGVTSPVQGATPSTAISNGTGYTATLTWDDTPALVGGKFDYGKQYTATITLTAATGYTFAGAFANTAQIAGFTVNGIAPEWVSNSGDVLKFKVTFPATSDNTPPDFASMVPADNATNVPVSGTIAITFNEAMDTDYANVSLKKHDGLSGNPSLPLTSVGWSNDNKTYTVSYSGLENNKQYMVSVIGDESPGNGFRDAAGNLISGGRYLYFTTAAPATVPSAALTVTDPVAGAAPATTVGGADAEKYSATLQWLDGPLMGASQYFEGAAFGNGKVYTAVVRLTAKPGYSFEHSVTGNFTINGDEASRYIFPPSYTEIIMYCEFPPTAATASGGNYADYDYGDEKNWD